MAGQGGDRERWRSHGSNFGLSQDGGKNLKPKRITDAHIVIVNATSLGCTIDGTGVYVLNLLRELCRTQSEFYFKIYLNRDCRSHVANLRFPANCTITWVSCFLSPDKGLPGHFLRLLFSNFLSLRYRNALIFNTSQIQAAFFGAKQVITIHDIIPLLFRKQNKRQYYFYRYFLRYALKKTKAIVTPSIHTKELLIKHYSLPDYKIRVIPHGVGILDMVKPAMDSINGERLIVYAGRITETKNVAGILRAFDQIGNKIDHNLLLIGGGGERLKSEVCSGKILRNDRLRNRVLFTGCISISGVISILKKAFLLIFPSFCEGFGLPPLEAMACGCPVIVSSAGSLPEVCGDAAYYVDPHNINSIADGMLKVITDDNLRNTLISRGFERSRLFKWSSSFSNHLAVFTEVVAS